MNHATTPVFDSLRAAVLYGEQRHAGGPPRHPDIYRELCREFGHEMMGGRTAYIPPPRRTLDYAEGTWPPLVFRIESRLVPPRVPTLSGRRLRRVTNLDPAVMSMMNAGAAERAR